MYPTYNDLRTYLNKQLRINREKGKTVIIGSRVHLIIASFYRSYTDYLALFDPIDCQFLFAVIYKDGCFNAISDYQPTYDMMIDDAARKYSEIV